MGTRRRKPMEIDLLPFLSVLSCTIGTLILLVVVIATSSLGDQRTITILPEVTDGSNDSKKPRYIDCRGDGAFLHLTKNLVPQAQIETSSVLENYLSSVDLQQRREYIIVAIRPDGYSCFDAVRQRIEAKSINIGFEPVDAGWKLDIKQ